jgi:hypothetical protein
MKTTLSAVVFLVSASSHAFNVGGYRLGMNNDEAAKLGLADCAFSQKFARCTLTGLPEVDGIRGRGTVEFTNKRITEISASFMLKSPLLGPADFEPYLKNLAIDECTSVGYRDTHIPSHHVRSRNVSWHLYCLHPIDQYREIRLYALGSFHVTVSRERNKVNSIKDRMKNEKAAALREKASREFEKGK